LPNPPLEVISIYSIPDTQATFRIASTRLRLRRFHVHLLQLLADFPKNNRERKTVQDAAHEVKSTASWGAIMESKFSQSKILASSVYLLDAPLELDLLPEGRLTGPFEEELVPLLCILFAEGCLVELDEDMEPEDLPLESRNCVLPDEDWLEPTVLPLESRNSILPSRDSCACPIVRPDWERITVLPPPAGLEVLSEDPRVCPLEFRNVTRSP
jgi:hypothetical protein